MNRITKTNQKLAFAQIDEKFEIAEIITVLSSVSVIKLLIELGKIKPYLSRNEANKKYGRAFMDLLFMSGKLKIIKDGENTSKYRLDRVQLEALAATNHMTAWADSRPDAIKY